MTTVITSLFAVLREFSTPRLHWVSRPADPRTSRVCGPFSFAEPRIHPKETAANAGNARRLARVTDTEPTHKTELASVAIKEVVCGNAWDRLVQVVSRNPPAGCNNSKSGRCWRSSHSRQVPTRRSGYRTTMQRGLEWLAANLADGRCSVLPTQTPSASTRPTTKHSAAARYQSAPFRSSTVSQSSGWRTGSYTTTRSRYPTRQDHASRGNSDATCMTASVHNTP
jgi:hypothetical protein